MTIYECLGCGKYFHEFDEKQICYEEEYGVVGDVNGHTYANVACCPHCQSTDYKEEKNAEGVCDALNEWDKFRKERKYEIRNYK